MSRRIVSGIMLTVLITSLLTFAFNVQLTKSDWTWTETIYIRADGSVDPSNAPISTVDKVTYTLTDNIVGNVPANSSAIVVERDNIVLDGAGYTVQGTGSGKGIDLTERINVTIKNMTIKAFGDGIHHMWFYFSSPSNIIISGNNIKNNYCGIVFAGSAYSSISENNITNNSRGILLSSCYKNSIIRNEITNNTEGIWLCLGNYRNIIVGNNIKNNGVGIKINCSSDNFFYHNNFVNNTDQIYPTGKDEFWDDGYPSGGNYWSNYNGTDLYSGPYQNETGSDGIGDTPYVINADNQDHYPLMKPYTGIGIISVTPSKTVVGQNYTLTINVIIFNYGNSTETFNVTAYTNTTVLTTFTNTTLKSRNSITLTFTWNTTGFAKGDYTIIAVANTVPGEIDIEDNTFTDGIVQVAMPGDITADGKVNVYDLRELAIAYGTKIGQPKYNPNADINGDGKINIYDLRILAKNYGKTDP